MNSQRPSLKQEIALVLILSSVKSSVNYSKKAIKNHHGEVLKSNDQSATQIFKKMDRRYLHGTGCLDRYWLADEASTQHSVLGEFPDFSGVGDRPTDITAARSILHFPHNERLMNLNPAVNKNNYDKKTKHDHLLIHETTDVVIGDCRDHVCPLSTS